MVFIKRFLGGLLVLSVLLSSFAFPAVAENEELPSKAEVIGKGLATADHLLLRFFVQFDQSSPPDATAIIETDTGTESVTVSPEAWVDTTGLYGPVYVENDHVFYYSVALSAKRMTDTVTLSIKGRNGQELLTHDNQYSIEQYCHYWIDFYKENLSDKSIAKTCSAMLLYGRTAQLSLNYRIDRLPQIDSELMHDILENGLSTTKEEEPGVEISKVAHIPDIKELGNPTQISALQLMTLIRNGNIQQRGYYEVTDGEGLQFEVASDNKKTYDLNHAVIKFSAANNGTAVTVGSGIRSLALKNATFIVSNGAGGIKIAENAKSIQLSNINVTGSAAFGIQNLGAELTLHKSSVFSSSFGTPTVGVLATGTDVLVNCCRFDGLEIGVQDIGNGAVVEENHFTSCDIGVLMETSNTVVWYNTFKGGDCGVKAVFAKSELSAGESDGYNLLTAMNVISDATVSVLYQNVSNGVVLLNRLDNANISGCTNVYVNENTIEQSLTLSQNQYLIANQNIAANGGIVASDNQNVNGSDLTDLSQRNETGANEALLPHVNKEQFVGMTRKAEIRSASGSSSLAEYLTSKVKTQKIIIVPPGAYIGSPMSFSDVKDVKIYAYGVLDELTSNTNTAVQFKNSERTEIKGLFLSDAKYAHTQGTITYAKSDGTLEFIADPGYYNDFSNTNQFPVCEGRIYKSDSLLLFSSITTYGSKSYDLTTNTNTVRSCSWNVLPERGDRVVFCDRGTAHGFYFESCSEMKLEDVTVYGTAGFAELDKYNDVAPTLHRFAVMSGPAPVLTGTLADYSSYEDLVSVDSYGRIRSASPLLTTLDATHCTSARHGIRIISSYFELTDDDITNVNAYPGQAVSYDASTKTLTYKRCSVSIYQTLPEQFLAGDVVTVFSAKGKHILTATVKQGTTLISGSESNQDDLYTIVLEDDVQVSDASIESFGGQEKLLVQNLSASGNGFSIDNIKTEYCRARLLIQAASGEIKNSSLCGLTYGGVIVYPSFVDWPEVGFTTDLKIVNNLFDRGGVHSATWSDWQNLGNMSDIVIRSDNYRYCTANPDYCLQKNILISGNAFSNRYSQYAISVNCAQNVQITDNMFYSMNGKTAQEDTQSPILLLGGNGIVVDGNSFYVNTEDPVEIRNDVAQNVTGSDIT